MAMFWEFFTFELRFRLKSISTYVYFLLWFTFAFLSVASESFGPVGSSNGKVLLNGPYANSISDFYASLFGVIIMAAIFGTSILRDFQRDTYQILFTKPISKFGYLGGRWAGSLLTTVFVFSGIMFGTFAGTFAPWADHTRIGPNYLWWYVQPFLSIIVIQIFFLGSLFFAVAALTRKIFIVYLQGVALFMLYILGVTVYSTTRSLEHFWSGILDPVGLILFDNVTRYWTVIEKNTLLLPWDFSGNSPGVFLYNRFPGDVLTLTFSVSHTSRGFRDGNELAAFAYNGTFFDASFFPLIGYDQNFEIDDPRRRREEHLGPLEEMAQRGDAVYSRRNLFVPSSDWITFHTIVSTSADQIAIAPGYLQRTWQQNGRHYYEYSMGSTHIADFFAYLSGRYATRKEVYTGPNGPVNLEVYYDPAHTYDIDDMLASSRAGLDYYQTHYGPYQFTQYRIMEFPRYRQFAQSFPNTVPFSEGIGFIGRMLHKDDVDLTYFVTAHELGHQWWGHQLIGGQVQGSNMMSETLAQYSAYMVMQHKYGKDYMHKVLRHFLDRYLRGRAGEIRHEPPLALVQREPYVWYEKGGQIMYTLADYIGEDKMDLALHNFLMQYRYANATNQADAADSTRGAQAQDQPYPDTRMLVAAIRAQTPPELQYMVDDGFNRIVLYDNKALSATSQKTSDGKYKVTLKIQARKVQADGNGVETPMPLADYIEIGVFTGKKDEEKPLYMKKEKISQEHETFTIVVDQQPTRAGIDPYNKLIDRIADDNMIDVTRE